MSNSPLATQRLLSPNYTFGNFAKNGVTPHFMDGYLTALQCAQIFQPKSRQASSNYTIGYEGEICLVVEEHNRSWCSGNAANDKRCVTIECANNRDSSLPNATWESLIKLCADIAKRNGFRIDYTGSANGNLTFHRWFQDTDCPGKWLYYRRYELAQEINRVLDGKTPTPTPTPTPHTFGGTYKCMVNTLNVRTGPSTSYDIVAQYHKGETVVLENWYTSNGGYIWGRYIGISSGRYRYIAVGRDTGKVEDDDYLIKV